MLQYNKHAYSASTISPSYIACLRSTLQNINIIININNNIIYATYIKREYYVRHTKTLFFIFFNMISRF